MRKLVVKSQQTKEKIQMSWDMETKRQFSELLEAYDPNLSFSYAMFKLIKQAIKEWRLPGYIPLKKTGEVASPEPMPTPLDQLASKGAKLRIDKE